VVGVGCHLYAVDGDEEIVMIGLENLWFAAVPARDPNTRVSIL